ncbi:MAG: MBL fold metallo-hydrolase [Longimicrobiales bacterium]|nr:MBL fold metallo-hydrolase [Longimicrobiales bacterium]
MPLSRRTFLTSSAAAGATLAFPFAGAARPRQELTAVFTAIRGGVGHFTMRGGTVGYLLDADGTVVVDTQFPAQAQALLAGLEARSGRGRVDLLLNTHHHGDHTAGNPVFRGVAGRVVAHERAAEHMRNPPAGQPPEDQLYPDTTFADVWSGDVGGERVTARHFGPAHTSGDAVVTFERANVAHMGDLVFHRRHPVVDGAAGATLRGWIQVLERTVEVHGKDTVYIFGHAGAGLPVTGTFTDLLRFRDYLSAVLAHVGAALRAGRERDEFLAGEGTLPGFEEFGPFGRPGPREARTVAWSELSGERQFMEGS